MADKHVVYRGAYLLRWGRVLAGVLASVSLGYRPTVDVGAATQALPCSPEIETGRGSLTLTDR